MYKKLIVTLCLLVFLVPTYSEARTCLFDNFACVDIDAEDTSDSLFNAYNAWLRGDPDTSGRGTSASFRENNKTASTDQGIVGYIIDILEFINNVIIPLLFAFALLFFLFGVFRYLVNPNNIEQREKGTRTALYGVIAFVFLVSIWGIVNLFVGGLGFDQEEAICPDYLGDWCKSGAVSTNNIYSNNPSDGPYTAGSGPFLSDTPALVDFGCGSGVDCAVSRLAQLIFGGEQDRSSVFVNTFPPRAIDSTVAIAESATCSDGLTTLQTAAKREANQAAYAVYKRGGINRWNNISDTAATTRVVIDGDALATIKGQADDNNVLVVLLHPTERIDNLGLSMDGYGPSAAQLELLCESELQDVTVAVADGSSIWLSEKRNPGACPFNAAEREDLFIIDAIYALSLLNRSDRENEYFHFIRSQLIPTNLQDDFEDFEDIEFNTFMSREVRDIVTPELNATGLNITRDNISNACSLI